MAIVEITQKEVTLQTIADSLENITKTLGSFATKKDLADSQASFITKKDLSDVLSNHPTKKDLAESQANFATKSDLTNSQANFVTKKDLADSHSRLETLIDSLAITMSREVNRLEQKMDEGFESLDSKIDSLDEKVDRNQAYNVTLSDNILTHYTRREEHTYLDNRLKKVEHRVFA